MEKAFGKQELVACNTKMWSDEGQTRDSSMEMEMRQLLNIFKKNFITQRSFWTLRTLDIQNPATGESLNTAFENKQAKPNQYCWF